MYGIGFLTVVALAAGGIFYQLFYRAPTCADGRQNGQESGIDCGGACQAVCKPDVLTPVVLWSKIFNVSGSVYNVVAYIENPNINSENEKVSYAFKIYAADNTLLETREGETFIPKNKKFAVFEPGFNFAGKIPKRVEFEFTSFAAWTKNTSDDPALYIDYSPLLSTSSTPRIEGSVANNSEANISRLELTGLVLDGRENVVAASRTFVENLSRGASADFVFTWPKPFDLGVESCEQPLDIAVVLDKSGSMRSESVEPPEPFNTVKATAEDFIKNLKGNDRVAVVSFGTVAASERALTANVDASIDTVRNMTLSAASEQTNIGEGLYVALTELVGDQGRTEAKKVLVLLTDGVPTEPKMAGQTDYPKAFAESVSRDVKSAGIIVYTIGLGKGVHDELLRYIASSDAHYFPAPTKERLSQVYGEIASALCARKPNAIRVLYRIPQ